MLNEDPVGNPHGAENTNPSLEGDILVIEGAVDKDVGMEFSSAVHLARFHFCMDPSRLWMTTSLPFEVLLALLSAADLVL